MIEPDLRLENARLKAKLNYILKGSLTVRAQNIFPSYEMTDIDGAKNYIRRSLAHNLAHEIVRFADVEEWPDERVGTFMRAQVTILPDLYADIRDT